MTTVGIRELKSQLSRYLKRVRAGERLVVTERGEALGARPKARAVEPSPATIASLSAPRA